MRPSSRACARSTRCCPTTSARSRSSAAPDGFDARRDARARSYAYRVHTRHAGPSPFTLGRELWWPHAVDEDALHACAAPLPGTHDFTAFTPTDTEHVRFERDVESAAWARRDPETLVFSHHRRRLHAQHEPHPRRHHARGRRRPPQRSSPSPPCSTAPTAATRVRPPRRTASTSSASATSEPVEAAG